MGRLGSRGRERGRQNTQGRQGREEEGEKGEDIVGGLSRRSQVAFLHFAGISKEERDIC